MLTGTKDEQHFGGGRGGKRGKRAKGATGCSWLLAAPAPANRRAGAREGGGGTARLEGQREEGESARRGTSLWASSIATTPHPAATRLSCFETRQTKALGSYDTHSLTVIVHRFLRSQGPKCIVSGWEGVIGTPVSVAFRLQHLGHPGLRIPRPIYASLAASRRGEPCSVVHLHPGTDGDSARLPA